MITFKQFITEGWHNEFHGKLLNISRVLAKQLDMRPYRVSVGKAADQDELGIAIRLIFDIQEQDRDNQEDLEAIAKAAFEKLLKKSFGKFREVKFENAPMTSSPTGRAIIARYIVPDNYGDM